MPSTASVLIFVFTAILALWPVACLLAAAHHAWRTLWRRLGLLALLLPLCTIAVSIGRWQLAPFMAPPAAPRPSLFLVAPGIGLALCCAVAAWWLLLRTFSDPVRPASAAGLSHPSDLSRS
jgi:hypothetical protein